MTLAPSRTSFNSSRLVRILADLDIAEIAESRQSFAERLSAWLDLTDAISLSGALKPTGASGHAAPGDTSPVREEFARVRAALIESIGTDDLPAAGNGRTRFPTPAAGATIDSAADFSPYHRYYLARQREMDASIGQLRAVARTALSSLSPRLKQLAALDAALEGALRPQERNLLATVPLLLAKRFGQLHRAHMDALGEKDIPDAPELWMQPGAWLAMFREEMQRALIAEIDLRLQPVAGLIEALAEEK